MVTTLATAPDSVRIGDAEYGRPFQSYGAVCYRNGTWLVSVSCDDGDRFVTRASLSVLEAFGIV